MGIRFNCQHCQRHLNVKAAQAGQAGQCPGCSKTIVVPRQSVAHALASSSAGDSSPSPDEEDASHLLDVDDQVTLDGIQAGSDLQTATGATSETQSSDTKPKSKFRVSDPSNSGLFLLDRPAPPPEFGVVDPIEEAPSKVWYFRSREIGERGPLKSKVMQAHLDCGDVVIGCMVWREDWDDWVPAEEAFPALKQQAKTNRRKARLEKAMKNANLSTASPDSEPTKRSLPVKYVLFYTAVVIGLGIIAALVATVVNMLK